MHWDRLQLASFAAAIALADCAPPPEAPVAHRAIAGQVCSAVTGRPGVDAIVTARAHEDGREVSALSDENGFVRLDDIAVGTHDVVIELEQEAARVIEDLDVGADADTYLMDSPCRNEEAS